MWKGHDLATAQVTSGLVDVEIRSSSFTCLISRQSKTVAYVSVLNVITNKT